MKKISFNKFLDFLEEGEDEIPAKIHICPPVELGDAESDQDSDKSDNEFEGNFNHLPAGILSTDIILEEDESLVSAEPSMATETTKHKKKKSELIWKKEINNLRAANFVPTCKPNAEDFLKSRINNPFEAFQAYCTDELLDHIVSETNKYASQHNVNDLNVNRNEILTIIGIMLISGYHPLPNRRLYWENDPDVYTEIVAEAVRRDRFDTILKYLHFADDNNFEKADRFYKIRPLFDYLNQSFKQIETNEGVCIDESMIPYYGRHGAKKFIRGKPVKFGFKLWVAADPSGYIYHVEPYSGASDKIKNTGLGQGADVVLGLVEQMNLNPGTGLYFNNFFTSVNLMQELTKKGLAATGTLRENRISTSMQLDDRSVWNQKKRGDMTCSSCDNLLVVRWKDNSIITVLTNCHSLHPMKTATRYSRTEKKNIIVEVPGPIAKYNANTGGVNLSDQFVGNYKCNVRVKKWWWTFFSWSVDVSCVQAWLLYRRLGHEIPLLDFRRECTVLILKTFGTPRVRPGPRSAVEFNHGVNQSKTDGIDHIIVRGKSKYRRCRACKNRTLFLCQKCDASLHPDPCFKAFHTE